ncbi:MAG TPA: SUMF1/EgtB/PvdO family nonheme iron enzyme, partial [Acidimicrobiales bacterium]
MVVQHEHQHDETMLATLQLMAAPGYRPVAAPDAAPAPGFVPAAEVRLPGGEFVMGTSSDPWALDNERPAHPAHLSPFWLDATPVTNAAYADFVADGGYADRRWWTAEGWEWRGGARAEHPQYWERSGEGWAVDRFGRPHALVADAPVQHVCWYEADAYARWAGKRLPTEAEWEYAASWGRDGRKHRWPWGDVEPTPAHASLWLGPSAFGPAPVTAHPAGANPWGVVGLIGGVWEWTASDFTGHPGFRAHPYREYSEVFFGPDHKVLRGGSWATHPSCIRATFRNWDYPVRRQIFAGFRCARDA